MATNPAAVLAKYKRNTANAADDLKIGINAVTVAPTQKAAAAVDKYARGVQDAVSSGRFVNGCNAVSLQDWKDASINKGVRNYQVGTQNLSNRAMKNMADQQAMAATIKAEVDAMPNNTEAESEARQLYASRRMREYGRMRRA